MIISTLGSQMRSNEYSAMHKTDFVFEKNNYIFPKSTFNIEKAGAKRSTVIKKICKRLLSLIDTTEINVED